MDSEWDLLLRALVAAFLAGLVGWDREYLNKPAGIRTHALVGLGAALFTAASILILGDAYDAGGRGDAVRIPAAIVTGVGFLGAGAILRSGDRVIGLTTAAGIWITASIGILIGSGFWIVGVGGTVLVLIITNSTSALSIRQNRGET